MFVTDASEVRRYAGTVVLALKDDAMLWFAYPKLSGAIKTDINRDAGWEPLRALGFDTVAAVSIDDTWTALRFRPADRIRRA